MSFDISVDDDALNKMADTVRAEAELTFATQAQVCSLQSQISFLTARLDAMAAAAANEAVAADVLREIVK